jgi:acetyltransferase-like isoleucine patch superfamily enzyme
MQIIRNDKAPFLVALAYFIGNHFFINHMPYVLKNAYLRKILHIKIGKQTSIARSVFVTGNKIEIGSNSVVNRQVYLDGRAELKIGNNVNISHRVIIQTLTHDHQNPNFIAIEKPVQISNDVWIGAGAIICPGIKIGRGAVVGAGAVVTKNVKEFTVVAGNPAKDIGVRAAEIQYKSAYFPYFDTDIQP